MFTKKSIFHRDSVLIVFAFLLALVGPAYTVSAAVVEQAPVQLNVPPVVTAISTSYNHTCERWSDGTVKCWGHNNNSGQLTVPDLGAGESWVEVSAGGNHTCARKNDDTIQCWGRGVEGQITVPTPNYDWMAVATGAAHSCAFQSDAVLSCWGFNDSGQTNVPSSVSFGQVSAGDFHTCGIDLDGTLRCWGQATYGKTTVPTLSAGEYWKQVDGGGEHTCGIKSDDTVQCWGAGTTIGAPPEYGQSIAPTGTFKQVSAGELHTCGLKTDNTIQCWGDSSSGKTTVPEPNENWAQVSAGNWHTCGLKIDGTLRCWGVSWTAPVMAISPATLPVGGLGAYTQNLTASDGTSPYDYPPYTFSVVSGSVPDGLTLNADGTWGGEATTEGVFNFTVEAKDALNIAAQRDYSLRIDTTPPTVVSITRAGASPTVSTSVNFTVTFSEDVTGVTEDDFILQPSPGLVGGSVTNVSPALAQSVYYVSVNTGIGTGMVHLDLNDNNSIKDLALNPLGGTGEDDGDFTGGEIYTIVTAVQTFSTAKKDGWVLETAEVGSGGVVNATASTLRLGDDANRKQYRSILSFDTGAVLPDTAVITRVTLKIYKQKTIGKGNPVITFKGFIVDIKKGIYGKPTLQATDFQAKASKTIGPFQPSLIGNQYTLDLTSGKDSINKWATGGGLTQIRLRFKLDDNNNSVANYLSLYSGSGNVLYIPRLEVEFYVP